MDNKIKVHVLHCGDTIVDEACIYKSDSKNPLAFTGIFRSKKHQKMIPCSTYLIEHPKGKILIDTAWNKTVRKHPVKELYPLHYQINRPILLPGQAVDEVLNSMGIKPKDLDYVVLSHLHTDHVSGLQLVKDAKNILVSKDELEFAKENKIKYVSRMWDGINFQTFCLSPSEYGPEKRSFDLFGDDTVIFVPVPGHTPGLMATIVKNNGKFLVLTADCGYSTKSWEQMILPGVISDESEVRRSFEWIREMAHNENCLAALANHEPNLPATVFEF